jgi:hypothetical protein
MNGSQSNRAYRQPSGDAVAFNDAEISPSRTAMAVLPLTLANDFELDGGIFLSLPPPPRAVCSRHNDAMHITIV